MEAITYSLPGFEGPLDLLLHLVQKHKLSITDIPIAALLEQYMAVIAAWQQEDLEVATEFLDMAARLVHIKTVMLLPQHEEAEDLRRELSGELMEYQLCQAMARRLAERHVGGDIFVREPTPLPRDHTYRRRHETDELYAAYLAAAGRGRRRLPPPAQAFQGIVARTIVPVSAKIVAVLRRVRRGGQVTYRSLFAGARSKSDLVATFLAVLELVKAKRIRVEGEGDDSWICPGTATRQQEVSTVGD